MSSSGDNTAKKLDPKFEESTAIMTDPTLAPPKLNIDDDVVDENFSFDQKTVVEKTFAKPLPPPLNKPITPPPAKATVPETTVTASHASARAVKTAVKIDPPLTPPPVSMSSKKKNQKSQFKLPPVVQNLLQNKRALAGVAAVFAVMIVMSVWKSHQPRKLDLHLEESGRQPTVMGETAPTDVHTAEQVATRFETVFQKVQSDSGEVFR